MKKNFIKEIRMLLTYYLKNKSKVGKYLLLAGVFLLMAMAINGFKVLYPYQFLISIPFLFLFGRYILKAFLFNAKKLEKSALFHFLKRVFIRYEKILFVCIVLVIFLYIGSQLVPRDKNPFEDLSKEELTLYVDDSIQVSSILLDDIESSGNELLDSGLLSKENPSADELVLLHNLWDQFLYSAKLSENMTDVHRYFSHIPLFDMPETHLKSFVISYSLYMKKFEYFDKVIHASEGNERVIKALNEYSVVFGAKNSYYDIRDRHVSHETFLRRNAGRFYLYLLQKTVDDSQFDEAYQTLVRESSHSYEYIARRIPTTVAIFFSDTKRDIERTLFTGWFPIQKNVANALGNILVSSRRETFISIEQIEEMRQVLRPGDILIQRRNWHASNVGIPGFWPHAALYIGSIEEANRFYSDIFPYNGYVQFSDLVEKEYPLLYEKYKTVDQSGYAYAVIEGLADGIILQSLEKSAKADYLGVLRPTLEKRDTLKAVLRSFENYGKSYDYNFDFETRDEIVCSELVYDAYLATSDKKGIYFPLETTAGRKMISPNNMVKKYFNEKGTPAQELEFVYFLDGNESLLRAFVKDEAAFSTSWTRPKFSHLQE